MCPTTRHVGRCVGAAGVEEVDGAELAVRAYAPQRREACWV